MLNNLHVKLTIVADQLKFSNIRSCSKVLGKKIENFKDKVEGFQYLCRFEIIIQEVINGADQIRVSVQ